MEFQFHPASRSGAVRNIVLHERGEKVAIVLTGLAAILAASLWVTVPTVLRRALRGETAPRLVKESAAAEKDRRAVESRLSGLRQRAADAGNLLSRIAFVYGVAPARWPRSLNPETGVLAGNDPERLARGLTRYLAGLERASGILEAEESADPSLAGRSPALLPLAGELVEPSAFFGPRLSPWTGSEEFFLGLDLAAPAGTSVIAPAAGAVVFTGEVSPSMNSRLRRFGRIVVLTHGAGGATLYGHLAKIDVRRGEHVLRGQRLGAVGATGWAMSPGLHYEYWRDDGGALAPTDPAFAILDRRLTRREISLEQMRATSAPGSIAPLPGMSRTVPSRSPRQRRYAEVAHDPDV